MLGLWRNFLLGVGALLVVLAGFLFLSPVSETAILKQRLETEGVTAEAKVLDKRFEEYREYERGGKARRNVRAKDYTVQYTYYVDAAFNTADGKAVRARVEVPGKDYDVIVIGSSTPILYHPESAATINRLKNYSLPYRDDVRLERGLKDVMGWLALLLAPIPLWFGRPRGGGGSTNANVGWSQNIMDRMGKTGDQRVAPSPPRYVAATPAGPPKGFGRRR